MKIFSLLEGTFYIGVEKKIISSKDPIVETLDLNKHLKLGVCPFLIHLNNEWILFDVGLGKTDGLIGHHNIFHHLQSHSISPNQLSKIFISHLHSDHYGGILNKNIATDEYQLSFPNATYYFNKKDWYDRREHTLARHFKISLEQLDKLFAKNIHLVDNSLREKNIFITTCGGHTQNHLAFKIEKKNKVVFFAADVAPQLFQMHKNIKAKYDFEPDTSYRLRKEWWETANKEKWTFLFYHDLKNNIYKVD